MRKMRIFALLLVIVSLLSSCSSSPDSSAGVSSIPFYVGDSGAQIAMMAPEEEEESPLIKAVWNAVLEFSGAEGFTKGLYKTHKEEMESTIQLAVKSGAEIFILVGDGMDEVLTLYQNEYPEQKFILVVDQNETELAENSAVLQFNPEQAGWLAGYAAMYEYITGFLYFESSDNIARRYALGFFFGLEAAAETLDYAANSVEVTPVWITETKSEQDIFDEVINYLEASQTKAVFTNYANIQNEVLSIASQMEVPSIASGYDYTPEEALPVAIAQSSPAGALVWLLTLWKNDKFPSAQVAQADILNEGERLYFEESKLEKFSSNIYQAALQKFEESKAGEYMHSFIKNGYVTSPQEISFSRVITEKDKKTYSYLPPSGSDSSLDTSTPEEDVSTIEV